MDFFTGDSDLRKIARHKDCKKLVHFIASFSSFSLSLSLSLSHTHTHTHTTLLCISSCSPFTITQSFLFFLSSIQISISDIICYVKHFSFLCLSVWSCKQSFTETAALFLWLAIKKHGPIRSYSSDGKAQDCHLAALGSIPASAKLKLYCLNKTHIDGHIMSDK